MNKNHCWYKLNVKHTSNAISMHWRFPEIQGNYGIWSLDGQIKNIFTEEWLEHMGSVGLYPEHIMLFYRGIGERSTGAHVDILPPGKPPLEFTTAALNFVLMGDNSEMVWYETPEKPKDVSFTPAKTPYIEWKKTELKEIDRVHVGRELMVVRTNVPHTVEMGNTPRWCISTRLFENHKLTWEETIERLRSTGLIKERE